MQMFLSTPKFNKQYVYKNPKNTYQEFVNAFAFYKMTSTGSPRPDKETICQESNEEWSLIKKYPKETIEDKICEYSNSPIQLRMYDYLFEPATSPSTIVIVAAIATTAAIIFRRIDFL